MGNETINIIDVMRTARLPVSTSEIGCGPIRTRGCCSSDLKIGIEGRYLYAEAGRIGSLTLHKGDVFPGKHCYIGGTS